MFICDDCHKKVSGDDGFHMARSFGPCEGCGKTRDCADCHCARRMREDLDKNGLPIKKGNA